MKTCRIASVWICVLAGLAIADGAADRPAVDDRARWIADYYRIRASELNLDKATMSKLGEKVSAVIAARREWFKANAARLGELELERTKAAGDGHASKLKAVQTQLDELLAHGEQATAGAHVQAMLELSPDQRADWYALDLADLASACAEEHGGIEDCRDEWAAMDMIRAKSRELAGIQDGAELAKASQDACTAITNHIQGVAKAHGAPAVGRSGASKSAGGVANIPSAATGKGRTKPKGSSSGKPAVPAALEVDPKIPSVREWQLLQERDALRRELMELCVEKVDLMLELNELDKAVERQMEDIASLRRQLDDCRKKKRAR